MFLKVKFNTVDSRDVCGDSEFSKGTQMVYNAYLLFVQSFTFTLSSPILTKPAPLTVVLLHTHYDMLPQVRGGKVLSEMVGR